MKCRTKRLIFLLSLTTKASNAFNIQQPTIKIESITRRSIIAGTAALVSIESSPVFASTTTTATATATATANLECLKDLQPCAKDHVRLFFCRHGETEYNRLGLVQGSRIDADLNPIGELQAARLGQALALSTEHPPVFFHSPLHRTKQTTLIAAAQYKFAAEYYDYKIKKATIQVLSDLKEIDFGSSTEGKDVETSKLSIASTYAAWAMGNIDVKMTADGESMREVLERVSKSLYQLQRAASKAPGRSVVAVSHSSFLRVLLATCQQTNLLDLRKTLKLGNCCINVLDLPLIRVGSTPTQRITSSSPLLGGPLSLAPLNYSCQLPQSTVVRVNEQQHLVGVQKECQIQLQS